MAATQSLASLRQPPVVGQSYLVPFVRHNWFGVEADWPVLGPAHTDADFFAFPGRHYHVDARFVPGVLARRIERHSAYAGGVAAAAQAYPLSKRHGPKETDIPTGRPAVKRFRCRSADMPYYHASREAVQKLRKHYGEPAAPIVLNDGRRLCPHRKVDLSQCPVDASGIVTCPLHGLRVRLRAEAATDDASSDKPA